MAVVYPNANGDWSTVANWLSGGAPYGQLPQSGDTVCLNGKTIAADIDINIGSGTITTVATAPAVAGGYITCSAARNITANLLGGSKILELSHSVGTVAIIGNVSAGVTSVCINNTSTGNVSITGIVTGGTSSNIHGVNMSSGNITVTGSVIGGSNGIAIVTSSPSVVITVNGTVSGKANYAISCGAATVVNITGVISSTAGGKSGVYCPTGTLNFSGVLQNNGGVMAVIVNLMIVSSTAETTWTMQNDASQTAILSTNETDIYLPAVSNVRSGTTYGSLGQFTGACAIPPPESVALNVPTDNTVGTMQITPPDIQAACESALTAYGAAKTSDLSSIDIQTGLTTYGAAKTSDLSGIDIGAGLTAYGAAKTTDIINELKTSPEDVAERIRNLATVEAVGDIHAT